MTTNKEKTTTRKHCPRNTERKKGGKKRFLVPFQNKLHASTADSQIFLFKAKAAPAEICLQFAVKSERYREGAMENITQA